VSQQGPSRRLRNTSASDSYYDDGLNDESSAVKGDEPMLHGMMLRLLCDVGHDMSGGEEDNDSAGVPDVNVDSDTTSQVDLTSHVLR